MATSQRVAAAFSPIFVVLLCFQVSANGVAHAESDAASTLPPPVVLIVFDALPWSSLLDADGQIDARFYPEFARFAASATVLTDTTTVAESIRDALPAIVTGRLPRPERVEAIAAEYPSSLFSILSSGYEQNVLETETALLPDGRSRAVHEARVQRMRSDRNEDVSEHHAFRRFVRQIGPTVKRAHREERSSLHFAHVRIPRFPWHLSPEGTSYRPYRLSGARAGRWLEEPWWAEEGWRRHLLQLRFIDVLMGELRNGLEASGIADQALIIVTADYGRGFWPGESMRMVAETEHPEDILHVPLLIKRPGQTRGERSDRPTQTVDILPTILEASGLTPPSAVQGCSVFDSSCEPLEARRVLQSDVHGQRTLVPMPVEITERRRTLARKSTLVGTGEDPDRVYAFGPYAGLVGQRIEALDGATVVEAPAGAAQLDRQWVRAGRGARGPRIAAVLDLPEPTDGPRYVAVARNGRIETVVPAPVSRRGRREVLAMIPEARSGEPEALLALYLVAGSPEAPRLRPLTLRSPRMKAKPKTKPAG